MGFCSQGAALPSSAAWLRLLHNGHVLRILSLQQLSVKKWPLVTSIPRSERGQCSFLGMLRRLGTHNAPAGQVNIQSWEGSRMSFNKGNVNVVRKPVLLLLLMAIPAFVWGQERKGESGPKAPAHSSKPSTPHKTTPSHSTASSHETTPSHTSPTTASHSTAPTHTTTPSHPNAAATSAAVANHGASVGSSHGVPGRTVSLHGGGTANLRPNGQIRSVDRNGMHIEHGVNGGRTIVSEHNGVRVVNTGAHAGYVQRAYVVRGGNTYVSRTYVMGGVVRVGVYRSYYWGGHPYYGYYPGYWYHPGFYGWGYRPWGAPVYWGVGFWGWGGAPWFGFYGGYFAPYPYYASPAFWLTDYLVAAELQSAYAAREEAREDAIAADHDAYYGGGSNNTPATASNAVTLTPEVKQAITEEVKAQLAEQQAAAAQNGAAGGGGASAAPAPTSGQVPPALDPARRTFVVDTSLTVVANGQECGLTAGDVITRITDTPDADGKVNASVSSSKKSDCAAGQMVAVKVDDLMEMHNHFQEQLDSGLAELAKKQGTNGLPKAPDTGTTPSDVPPPAPDASAAKALQDQQQAADQTEQQVKQEAAAAPGGGGL
jgi:hypothetical protein